ncbi:glycoside hydrolase family 5 protein [Hyaloscypha variabilis F]|uniref:mannan endo-1,4-beta-mannosidase n=1 Tax=Hyaloscypha variabilis (strain UAMH 11265 / GT02V1 / F) TaxID=1149755 RepID=A0A2J6RHJ2_HYAVF|nr:glycoside hydrolase family 5 protein [Hyaloscypha variabilis F]
MKCLAVCILSFAWAVKAQQSAYGQCGGTTYTGPTSCVAGYACTSYNPYYYQCVPGKKNTHISVSSTASIKTSTTTSSAVVTTETGYPKTHGLFFNIDGVVEYYAGTNCYWCGFLTADGDVDHVFADIASSGLKIVRVWGFNDVNTIPSTGTVWYQYLASSGSEINTGEYGLQRLDYVVASAEKYDVKLIINFVNNWSDYGGIAAYVAAFGGNSSTWFTDTESQAQYRTYIEAVVSRYTTSSAILSWELANEPRCSGCDVSVIYNWAASTSAYIKSLDPNHMVTMGDEGFGPLPGSDGSYPFTTSAGGYDWQMNLEISTLDFATYHLYPQSWGTSASWGDLWITTHAAACVNASKPCLLEEFGYSDECEAVESGWQSLSLDTTGQAADMFWQYGDVLPSCDCETSQDGNTVYFNTSDWTCFVTDHIEAIDAIYG